MPRLTQVAHDELSAIIQPGDRVIDATAGNGHDTQFLANSVGPTGHVLAIDRQQSAIINTTERLKNVGLLERAKLVEGSHADILSMVPPSWMRSVKAIVFNLGYLPGSDKSIITSRISTEAALEASLQLLAKGGLLSIMVYRGHEGGQEEAALMLRWLELRGDHFSHIQWNDGDFPTATSPRLLSAFRS